MFSMKPYWKVVRFASWWNQGNSLYSSAGKGCLQFSWPTQIYITVIFQTAETALIGGAWRNSAIRCTLVHVCQPDYKTKMFFHVQKNAIIKIAIVQIISKCLIKGKIKEFLFSINHTLNFNSDHNLFKLLFLYM